MVFHHGMKHAHRNRVKLGMLVSQGPIMFYIRFPAGKFIRSSVLPKSQKVSGGFLKWEYPKIMVFNTKYWFNDLWMIWGAPMTLNTYIFVSSNVTLTCLKPPIRTSQSVQSVFLPRLMDRQLCEGWRLAPVDPGCLGINMSKHQKSIGISALP